LDTNVNNIGKNDWVLIGLVAYVRKNAFQMPKPIEKLSDVHVTFYVCTQSFVKKYNFYGMCKKIKNVS
jgi:hypothetical protein